MKPKVKRTQKVYGSEYVEGFETLNEQHAIIHDLAHKNRAKFEERVIESGRFTRESVRFAGTVDRDIEVSIWFATNINDGTPGDYFGIDFTGQQ